MAITQALCNSFKLELLGMGTHAPTDIFKMALFTSAATLSKSTTVYSTTNEVVGTGYTEGGAVLTSLAITLDGDTAVLDWGTDPVWASSTITARGALIYNSTKGNKSVASIDFGSDINSVNGTFTAVIPVATAAAGLIRIV